MEQVLLRPMRLEAVAKLQQAGIESADFEVKQLLQFVLQLPPAKLLLCDTVSLEQESMFQQLLTKRIDGQPLQYLIGEWDFYGRSYQVGPGVLIPRADTEVLCQVALEFLQTRTNPTTLDLCAGSGCIAITLEQECSHKLVQAVEYSQEAYRYLTQNITANHSGVQAIFDDVLAPKFALECYDLIVSNPPYLNQTDMDNLQKEVTFEPQMALYAPQNGYLFYQQIPTIYWQHLKPGGMLCFEVGIGQAQTVATILQKQGFCDIAIQDDLQGIARVVSGRKKE